MVTNTAIHIIVPVIMGIIIGIIEIYFVYEDEASVSGKDFFKEMIHGLTFAIIGVLAANNVMWLINQSWFPNFLTGFLYIDKNTGISVVASAIITLYMLLKMSITHALKGMRGSYSEKFWHKLAISLAVGFSPFYIDPLYTMNFVLNIASSFPYLPL